MKITWLGHSSFLIETSKGTKIVTDPYESGGYGGAVGYAPIDIEADIVTVSHGHSDHNYTKPFKAARIVDAVGKVSIKDVGIEGVSSYHDKEKGRARGLNIIFIIKADGLKVVHLGDLGTLDIDTRNIDGCDVLLVPIGGTFTLDSAEASEFMERIKPAVTVPMHFKTEKLAFSIEGLSKFLQGKSYEQKDVLEISFENAGSFKNVVALAYQR